MDHTIPYTGNEKYIIVSDSSNGPVISHVELNGKRITKDKKFATEQGSVDFWVAEYHRGNIDGL